MSSLTDPKGIKATARAIYEGGREHPLADLARLIDGAISDANFRGLGQFDVARWVAYVITEDQKARIAEADKTAPHGQFVPNPPGGLLDSAKPLPRVNSWENKPAPKNTAETPVIELEHLNSGMLQELLNPHPGKAARWIIDHLEPGAFDDLKAMAVPVGAPNPDPEYPKVPDAGEYPKVEWNDSRPVKVSYRQGPGLWDFLKDVPTIPDTPNPLEGFTKGWVAFGEKNPLPPLPDFPKLDLSGIPAMPVDIKESLERASEQLRESMERAAKAVRKGIDDARAAEARRILAEQPHEHIYGRGSNGLCRICGAESNSRRARAKRRAIHNEKAKAAAKYPQHAFGEEVDVLSHLMKARVHAPANHEGMVTVVWPDGRGMTLEHVTTLSAPASRLHEALKAKGDGHE
ncbi:hypothetical protein ArV1_051 [Arthrobacter phage vB_ArtM-ArV1]|uniref:Uncharacterized protein n=1 Tax=Arthrobacter phage vB_ArtM-ArV1 TaxID=1566993 RepID=A0A0A7HET0_9CAUD|nr:hypothetical protein ArV1_051 [Arthrobacter phage vB_ArtM-ArV1]AIZ01739.1 hypothetical protein ArV1_051 [Arthrobacter phage vB_ArtM-ArV1]